MTTLETQQLLTQLDRWPGPWDGVETGQLRQAVRDFQRDHGLQVTGETNCATIAAIKSAIA